MERPPWLDVDWSEHQRWVQVAGRPVNVVELGSGPPVVFVHGHSGSWQNWLLQLPVIAERHRAIALDLPGFGRSPMPRDPVSMSGYARIVDELLGELGVSAAAVFAPTARLGIFTLLLGGAAGYGVGLVLGEALNLVTGRKRGREMQVIASAGVLLVALTRSVASGVPLEFLLRDFGGIALVLVAISVASTRLR